MIVPAGDILILAGEFVHVQLLKNLPAVEFSFFCLHSFFHHCQKYLGIWF
jgi:hypothetical protein